MSDDKKHELAPVRHDELDVMTLGEVLVRSGLFKVKLGNGQDAPPEVAHAQAVVKVLAGRELGLQPLAAMSGIHIVEGKPTLGANLYSSFIRKHPVYDYRVIESSREACEIEFLRGKGKGAEILGRYSMTIEEAKASGLTHSSKGPKHNWKNHPDAMLFARCISQGARFFCPDVFEGHTVYTPDELEREDDQPGAVAPANAPAKRSEPRPAAKPERKILDAEVVKPSTEVPAPDREELARLAAACTALASQVAVAEKRAGIEKLIEQTAQQHDRTEARRVLEILKKRIEKTLAVQAEAARAKPIEPPAPTQTLDELFPVDDEAPPAAADEGDLPPMES